MIAEQTSTLAWIQTFIVNMYMNIRKKDDKRMQTLTLKFKAFWDLQSEQSMADHSPKIINYIDDEQIQFQCTIRIMMHIKVTNHFTLMVKIIFNALIASSSISL